MKLASLFLSAMLLPGVALVITPSSACAQQDEPAAAAPPDSSTVAYAVLPEAPVPQPADPQTQPSQSQPAQPATPSQQPAPNAAPAPAGSSSSSSSGSSAQTPPQQSQHDTAEEQLKAQEHQRVLGVMASFNTTQNPDALPLSSRQKFSLFFKSATDPWPFGLAAVVAGINQAHDSEPSWGQGMKGYATRFGASYSDYFIGNFFGNAVLPSLWHEDPRFFQKTSGSGFSRFLWAAASTVWCKRDNGKWGPNYSNVAGNLIGAAIGRAYYPASERTVSDTITDGLTVSAEGVVGAEVIEFWPDMVRHHRRKQAEKLARQQQQSSPPPADAAPSGK
jgi:hypothetical protein